MPNSISSFSAVQFCRRFSIASFWVASGVAVLNLVGWSGGIGILTRFNPLWPAMPWSAAVAVLLVVGGFLLGRFEPAGRGVWLWRWISALPGGAVMLFGLIEIGERLWAARGAEISLGASSALAGLGFVVGLRGPALWAVRIRQTIALVVAFVALLALEGFLVNGESLLAAPFFRGFSFLSALAFAGLSFGLLTAEPEVGVMRGFSAPTSGGRLLRRTLLPVVLLPVLITGIEQWGERRHWLTPGFGWLLDCVITIYLLGAVVWGTAWGIHRRDQERIEALEQLAQSEARYRKLVEMSPDAIFVATRERIENANLVAVRLMGGKGEQDLVGRSAWEHFHLESRNDLGPRLERLFAEGQAITLGKQRILRLDGSELEVELAATAIDHRGTRLAQVVFRDITERNRMENEAKQLRGQLELLVNTAPIVLYARNPDDNFACTYLSPNVARLLGYAPGELTKTSIAWAQKVHPEDAPRLFEELQRACAGESASVHVYRFLNKAGHYRWLQDEIRVVRSSTGHPTAIVGYWQDISESRRAAAALRRSEDLYRTTFDVAAVGVLHVRPSDLAIVRSNPAFTVMTGYTPEELRDRSLVSIVHAGDRDVDAGEVSRLLAGAIPSVQRDLRYVRRDGTAIWVAVTMSVARDTAGEPEHVVVVCSDISQRLQMEMQLRQAQKMEAVGQLAGGVAHDFNNMLTAILGHAQLLSINPALLPEQTESLHQIERASRRAASLTRQLLLFSRREVMQPARIELNETVANLTNMLGPLLGERIRLKLEPFDRAVLIHADPAMLEQVLVNLAVNARDAMHTGGELRIKVEIVEVPAAAAAGNPAGAYARLSVIDTGSGIPATVLPHIFEPFFTTKPPGKGTGLGLATVFGIAKQHRGWVNVETEVGRGSTFALFVPVLEGMSVVSQPARPPEVLRGKGEMILLVEDDPAVCEMTQTLLQGFNYVVIVAGDGADALQQWQLQKDAIALVVTDIVMPGTISGTELAARIQADRPNVPILLVSGYNPEAAGRLLNLPRLQSFLSKPFTLEDLLARVSALLTVSVPAPSPNGADSAGKGRDRTVQMPRR